MENVIAGIKDINLKLTLAFGIGLHHAGLHERDRKVVEELFCNQKIQVCLSYKGLEATQFKHVEHVFLKEMKCKSRLTSINEY